MQFDGEAVEIEGMEHVGWRWRSATDRLIWHMTSSPGGRSYPSDAIFEPLYVPRSKG
jgi:hypothetical protein